MHAVATAFSCDGAVLWHVPDSDVGSKKLFGRILAQYPADHRSTSIELPLHKTRNGYASRTGFAIGKNQPVVEPNFRTSTQVFRDHPFLDRDIDSMLAIPVEFDGAPRGSLNLYRSRPPKLSYDDVPRVRQIADLLPFLYNVLIDRITVSLLNEISSVLSKPPSDAAPEAIARERIDGICRAVSDAFHSDEASIFLTQVGKPNTFSLAGTSWHGEIKKTSYTASKDEGATGWVLKERKPVLIRNLLALKDDPAALDATYKGLRWLDSLDVAKAFAERYSSARITPPPASFIAAPVLGEQLYGVIRCSVIRNHPYVFSDRELRLLENVAAQIARYWSKTIGDDEIVRSIARLNKLVQEELGKPAPDPQVIYQHVLEVTRSTARVGEILDIRIFDDKKKELRFAAKLGEAWHAGTREEQERRWNKSFPVADPQQPSAGAYVYVHHKPYLVRDVSSTDEYYSETFPQTMQLLVVPIMAGTRFIGVIDVRAITEEPFPAYAEAAIELIGVQLGLYYELVAKINSLRETEKELESHINHLKQVQIQQGRVFKDLQHQFRTPILTARRRLRNVFRKMSEKELDPDLRAVRGHLARSNKVVYSTKLFADLSEDRPISLSLTTLNLEPFLRVLREAANDNEVIFESTSATKFKVNEHGFRSILADIRLDLNLFEHALYNVLDNAGKYSFQKTVVSISCGTTKNWFYLAVQNIGIRVRADETINCLKREWQSQTALARVGLGSGIGLWIVDNIMRAHEGEVSILPTTKDDVTEVRLNFPLTAVRRKTL